MTSGLTQYRNGAGQAVLSATARILFSAATQAKKGSAFKKASNFVIDAFREIENAGGTPDPELRLVRAQIEIYWKLIPQTGPLFWEDIRDDLVAASKDPSYRTDPMLQFFRGVAYYHTEEWEYSAESFSNLRTLKIPNKLRSAIRCSYQDEKGHSQIFEGTISNSSTGKTFVYSSELGNDVLVGKRFGNYSDDSVVNFKIGFSFNGPLALATDDAATTPKSR